MLPVIVLTGLGFWIWLATVFSALGFGVFFGGSFCFLFYNVSGLTIFSVRVSGLGFVFLCSKFVGRRDINVVGCYSVFLGNILVLECFRESWF